MMAAVRAAAVRAAAVETAACYGKQAASLLGSSGVSAMANVLEHVSRTGVEFIRCCPFDETTSMLPLTSQANGSG